MRRGIGVMSCLCYLTPNSDALPRSRLAFAKGMKYLNTPQLFDLLSSASCRTLNS